MKTESSVQNRFPNSIRLSNIGFNIISERNFVSGHERNAVTINHPRNSETLDF